MPAVPEEYVNKMYMNYLDCNPLDNGRLHPMELTLTRGVFLF